jgi:hypothetical protein
VGIHTERCELQVQQAHTDRDRVTKVAQRECNSLAWQLLQLQDRKATEAVDLKQQIHDLEVEKVALLQARKKGMPATTTNPKPNPNPIPNPNT